MNIDEEYQKIIDLLDSGSTELARELLNVKFPDSNEYGVFQSPLYSLVSNEQFVNILSYNEKISKLDGFVMITRSRNNIFSLNYDNVTNTIRLEHGNLDGSLRYTLTDTDRNKRKRRFILDLCLL